MELQLLRDDLTPVRTLGRLSIDGVYECHTLEDPVHDGPKVPGKTAIPAGRYRVVITYSPRFKRQLIELLDVPGFTGVRVHEGNDADDVEGCIATGQSRRHDSVLSSKLALAQLQRKVAGALAHHQDVFITVENPPTT